MCKYGAFQSHGGTPSHPFYFRIFQCKPSSIEGIPSFMEPPDVSKKKTIMYDGGMTQGPLTTTMPCELPCLDVPKRPNSQVPAICFCLKLGYPHNPQSTGEYPFYPLKWLPWCQKLHVSDASKYHPNIPFNLVIEINT